MKKSPNQIIVDNDIMRYKKNSLASLLALLALVFNCLYFCLLYGFRDLYFGSWRLGVSVILTLITLLVTFLSSEGIKNYNKKYAYVLLALAVVQFIRIFGLPLEALRYDMAEEATALTTRYFGVDMNSAACYALLVVYLCASIACLVSSAVIGYINCVRLENFKSKLDAGEISIEKSLAELEAEEQGENLSCGEVR